MYKYYLIYKEVKSEIGEEPIGWDGFETTIGRNDKSHGIGIEYADLELRFYDDISIAILKDTYAEDIDNQVLFIVEYDDIEEYRGAIDFKTYSEVYDGYHYVEAKIGDIGIETTFFNRQDQKVNLDSLEGFDGAVLPEYPFLHKEVTLPAKDLLFTSDTKTENDEISVMGGEPLDNQNRVYKIPCGAVNLSEIASINSETQLREIMIVPNGGGWDHYTFSYNDAIFVFDQQSGFKDTETFNLNINLSLNISKGEASAFIRITGYVLLVDSNGKMKEILNIASLTTVTDYNLIYNSPITMDRGEMIAVIINAFSIRTYDFEYTTKKGSFFSLQSLNKTEDTTANISLIHESLSRIVEATTNGAITVKSDYYGRINSNVNPVQQDGEGSLKAITTGLRIRKAFNEDGTETLFSLSFSDIFKGIQPIDNVGYGFVWENDERFLRVEPYQWFYSDNTVILEINNTKSKKTTIDTNNLFSSFKTGYKKFETEGVNGLDAFLTEREYRTRSTVASTKLEQVSEFVADTYAIEATRRLADDISTKDWRYDNETFVIQMAKNEQDYVVELGVVDSSGIIAPESLYNVRISPVRCAIKWLNRIFGWSNKQEELIFTSGKGNITAKTRIGDEFQLIGENDNLQSVPSILKSEFTEFEYPISIDEYNVIVRNPYGIIMMDGYPYYLNEMKYKWKSRIATFKVVPTNIN